MPILYDYTAGLSKLGEGKRAVSVNNVRHVIDII